MTEVIATDEFVEWYRMHASDEALMDDIDTSVGLLAERGTTLGHPHSSALKNANPLRELRIQSKGRPIRIFYAFDPQRDAVLLLGGDKTGDKRFYQRLIPKAMQIWKTYLREIAQE